MEENDLNDKGEFKSEKSEAPVCTHFTSQTMYTHFTYSDNEPAFLDVCFAPGGLDVAVHVFLGQIAYKFA